MATIRDDLSICIFSFSFYQADLLVAVSMTTVRDDLSTFCFTCAPHWAGRLSTGQEAR